MAIKFQSQLLYFIYRMNNVHTRSIACQYCVRENIANNNRLVRHQDKERQRAEREKWRKKKRREGLEEESKTPRLSDGCAKLARNHKRKHELSREDR